MKSNQARLAFCVFVLLLSLMFLGSIKTGEGRRLSIRAVNQGSCRTACELLTAAVPAEQRAAWEQLVQAAPELALRSSTINLHQLPQ